MALLVQIKKKLKDFDLQVEFSSEEGCLGLLGSSGCGKSMTLKCIAGIETPEEGRIVLNGRTLFDSEQKINLPPQKRRVGYLFQNYALFPHMTVRQNVEAGLTGSRRKLSQKEKTQRVGELLEQFHIGELADTVPARMSGGQQQRAALARIVASDPDILLLDEPFSALDSYLREQMLQEMQEFLQEYKKDVIMVSHNRDEIYQMCGQTAVMGTGVVKISGDTRELFQNPGTVHAARLTGCKNISRAVMVDKTHVFAKDWGITLFLGSWEIAQDADVAYVGIRAHDICAAQPGAENSMECELERISAAPFEMYLIVKNRRDEAEGLCPLWWKIPNNVWQSMNEKVPDSIALPPEHLILLSE